MGFIRDLFGKLAERVEKQKQEGKFAEMPALSKRRVREWIEKQDMARRRNFYAADRALVRECGRVRGELKKAGASPIEIQSRMIERGLIPDVRVKPKARKAGL